jgi:hypothetical protein
MTALLEFLDFALLAVMVGLLLWLIIDLMQDRDDK